MNNTCNIYNFSNTNNLDISINCNHNIIPEYRNNYNGIGYISKHFYRNSKDKIKYDNYLLNKSEEIIRDYDNIDNKLESIDNIDFTNLQDYSIKSKQEMKELKDMYDGSSISVSRKLNSMAEFLNLNQNKVYSDFVKENGLAKKFSATQNDIKFIPENDLEFYDFNSSNEYKINLNQNAGLNKQNIIGYKLIAKDGITENSNVNFKISYKNEANEFQLLDKRYSGTENSLTGLHTDRIIYFDHPIKTNEIKIQPVKPATNNSLEENKYISFQMKLIVDNNIVNLGDDNLTYYDMLKVFDEQYQKELSDKAKLKDNKYNITSGKLIYLILSIIFVLSILLLILYKITPEYITGKILGTYFIIVIILLYFFNHYIT